MPGRQEHVSAAEENEALTFHLISSATWANWAAVTAFYSALHWVDAYLAGVAIHPRNHNQRERYVSTDDNLIIVADHYGELRTICDGFRYRLVRRPSAQIEAAIHAELVPLRDHIKRVLV